MKQQTKSKALIILNIILLLALITIPAYAYWAGSIGGANNEDETAIEIGEGGDVDTVITLTELTASHGQLIPKDRPLGVDQTNEITLNLVFVWKENGTDFTEGINNHLGTLTLESAVTGTDLNLLNVAFTPETTIKLGEPTTVEVTITLTEPSTQAEYEKLQNEKEEIRITFAFNVVPK